MQTTKFKMSEMNCVMKIGPFWVKATYNNDKLKIKCTNKIGSKIEEETIKDFIDNLRDIIALYDKDPRAGIMSD